jgi:hypothetical protein
MVIIFPSWQTCRYWSASTRGACFVAGLARGKKKQRNSRARENPKHECEPVEVRSGCDNRGLLRLRARARRQGEYSSGFRRGGIALRAHCLRAPSLRPLPARPSVNLPDRTPDGIDSGQSERRHRGLARRLVAVRWRAALPGTKPALPRRVLRPTANFSWLVIKLRRGVIRDKSRKK